MPKFFITSLMSVGLSGAGAQAMTILTLPLLTRVYSPDSFGIWALLQSVAVLMATIATGRYELAIILPKNDSRAVNVLVLGLILALIITIVFVIMLLGASHWDLFDISKSLIWVAAPPLIFLGATTQLAFAWCTRTGAFMVYGIAQFGLALLSAVIPLGLGYYRADAIGLTMGILLASVISNFVLWAWLIKDLARLKLLRCIKVARLFQVACFYRAYPLYMTPYSLVGALRDRAIYFLIGVYSGIADVGLYLIAQRLSNAPNSLVASALRPVFYRHAVTMENREIKLLISNVMGWLVVLVIPPLVYFLYYPDYLIGLIFGPQWVAASSYVIILIISSLPLLFGNWMDRFLDVLGKQSAALIMEVVFSVLSISVMAGVFWLGGSLKLSITCMAIVMAVYFSSWIYIVFRLAKISLEPLFRVIESIVGLGILSALVIGLGEYLWGIVGATIIFILVWFAAFLLRKSTLSNLS